MANGRASEKNIAPHPALQDAFLRNAFAMLTEVKSAFVACRTFAEQEETKRACLLTKSRKQLADLTAERDTIFRFLDLSFAERRAVFDKLFSAADEALHAGNMEALEIISNAIIDLANQSPFKALGDIPPFHYAETNLHQRRVSENSSDKA